MKLKFDFGWYRGADPAFFVLRILEFGEGYKNGEGYKDFITIFSIKIARFLIGIHLWR